MGYALSLEDVCQTYRWLGHTGHTELTALHPNYRQGREHYDWNKRSGTLPKTAYARNEAEFLSFVQKHYAERMVVASLNDRPQAYLNEWGYARAAKEDEVKLSRNLFLDLDFQDKDQSVAQKTEFGAALRKQASDYFHDLGFLPPMVADSGRCWHLLCGYEPIMVSDVPDISDRLRKFSREFAHDQSDVLSKYEVRVDNTHDLRRMVKVYGTAKPDVGIVSRFYGGKRQEDAELRTYLLGMALDENAPAANRMKPMYGAALLQPGQELPQMFQSLIARDEKLKALYQGNGKPANADTSSSGYDFSLVRRLLSLGYRNIDDLATVLAARPEGAVRKGGRDEQYIRRTIANALLS